MVLVVVIVNVVVAIVAPAPCGSPGVCKLLQGLVMQWLCEVVVFYY